MDSSSTQPIDPPRNDPRAHRGSIALEQALIVSQQAHQGEQFTLVLHAPEIASLARPGQFVHLRAHDSLPMRRPLSLLAADPESGRISLLYKVVGHGSKLLSQRSAGDTLSVLGPIGNGFSIDDTFHRPLLIGGGVGMPPMLFLAERLTVERPALAPFVVLGSEVPFPFQPIASRRLVPGLPAAASHAMPGLEALGVDSRLASLQGYSGCLNGYVTDLARAWLRSLPADELATVRLQACGPTPMLRACTALAAEFGIACEVCLEEYMACAVGGCAGCVVRTRGAAGDAMRRVCVDGPVFDARSIVWV
ncbi:MAG: dihydroorotate dehydrogenase electron transfer subunit [Gammaproteobacteria bacterium]|nr:dihydroorotate dehydrogenase electron transfer subunit [Gammaproteobacteria bacterium]